MRWLWKTVKTVAKVTVVIAKFVLKVAKAIKEATKPHIDPPRRR